MDKIAIEQRTTGLNFNADGLADIQIWAPKVESVAVRINGKNTLSLTRNQCGYWRSLTDAIKPGMSYEIVAGDKVLPDIASLRQPDVHGPSVAFSVDEFSWSDQAWQNPPLEDYIVYELHTGTFSPQRTFAGVIQKLDHLVELGITAIELMPVNSFPGERNWGYDGVFPYAAQESYGGPAGLQELVNACHLKGLAVILDVVYNHLGPEGNHFTDYGPFFTQKYNTPWGNAVNFDDAGCDGVRRFFIDNALMWLRDFHIDALRLDAVHAIKDFSPKHILQEIREQTDLLIAHTGSQHYLIVECDLNDKRFIDPVEAGGYGMDAQWSDEFHHALRVTAGGKRDGYYADFERVTDLSEAFEHAYVYHGRYSIERQKTFGTDPVNNPGKQFVVFSQNHDQVGNRMLGERSSLLFSFEMQKLMAASVMISPFVPLLFMGEEYGEINPFLYFVSHTDRELIEAVRKGRKEEFKFFHARGETPDPQSTDTFERSRLRWERLTEEPHRTMFSYYRALISLRKKEPAFRNLNRSACTVEANRNDKMLRIIRSVDGYKLICLLNFSTDLRHISIAGNTERVFCSSDSQWNGPAAGDIPNSESGIALFPESILILKQHV
jgi:maltooligosyltrehalose trehalohydrolase